jgi:hypothetical protein
MISCGAAVIAYFDGAAMVTEGKHNIISVTRVGMGIYDVTTSYAPRNVTLSAYAPGTFLAKVFSVGATIFGAVGQYNGSAITLSGGKVVVRVNIKNSAGVDADYPFACAVWEI